MASEEPRKKERGGEAGVSSPLSAAGTAPSHLDMSTSGTREEPCRENRGNQVAKTPPSGGAAATSAVPLHSAHHPTRLSPRPALHELQCWPIHLIAACKPLALVLRFVTGGCVCACGTALPLPTTAALLPPPLLPSKVHGPGSGPHPACPGTQAARRWC